MRTETRGIHDGSGNLVKKTKQLFQTIGGIERLISQIEDPDTLALTTTNTYYDSGQLKQTLRPDGSWEYYEYNTNGCPTTIYSTYANEGPTTDADLCRIATNSYTPITGTGDNGTVRPTHPRQVIEKIQGYGISRRFYVILTGEEKEIRCQTYQANWDDTNNVVTITKTYTSGAFAGKVKSIKRPDGTMDFYEYSDNQAGTERTTTVCSGEPNGQYTAIQDGTVTVTVVGTAGEPLSRTVTDYVSEVDIEAVSYTNFDAFKRPGLITYLDGTQEQMTYACCGLDSKTDRQGVKTEYIYDDLGRLYSTRRTLVYHLTTFDAAGRVLSTTRQGTNGQGVTLSLTGERGALNLFSFCKNDSLNNWDVMGL